MNNTNKWLVGTVSASLLSAVALWEGTKYVAYLDIGGVPTVCQGYTSKPGDLVVFGKVYTKEECTVYTSDELRKTRIGVHACIDKPTKPNEFDSFTLMAYNVGVKGFCGSRAVRLFNAGDTVGACTAMAYGPKGEPVWSFVNKKFVQGLFNRRKYEMNMCLGSSEQNA